MEGWSPIREPDPRTDLAPGDVVDERVVVITAAGRARMRAKLAELDAYWTPERRAEGPPGVPSPRRRSHQRVIAYQLVLDASAVAAYAAPLIGLGEGVAEAADEPGALVAIPAFALIAVAANLDDPKPLDILVDQPHVYMRTFTTAMLRSWRRYASTTLLGGVDRACAALLVAYGRARSW